MLLLLLRIAKLLLLLIRHPHVEQRVNGCVILHLQASRIGKWCVGDARNRDAVDGRGGIVGRLIMRRMLLLIAVAQCIHIRIVNIALAIDKALKELRFIRCWEGRRHDRGW